MEPEPIKKRLDALDGLRGIAILLVLLSHLEMTALFDKGSNLLLKVIFDSGEIGVSILFILSGFLMSYLYSNPKSTLDFLQKRYTRIFPAFIAVCILLTVVSLNLEILKSVKDSLLWLFGICLIFYIFWVYVIKKISPKFSTLLFKTFIFLQIIVGLFYLFYIMQMDYTIYLTTLSEQTRAIINFFINATLTLPLGTYSGPLSSVYWSLGTEVYFYMLYPITAVPIISILAPRSKKTKILFLATTFPFFIGLYLISQKFLFFNLLHLELAYYFIGGLALGYFYKHNPINFDISSKKSKLISFLSIPLFIGTIIIYHQLLILLPSSLDPYIKTIFTLPFTLLVLLTLFEHTHLANVLNLKGFIGIGTISYSMYLIHMFIYDIVEAHFADPTNLNDILFFISISVIGTILVAIGMYFLVERPYFKKRKDAFSEIKVKTSEIKQPKIVKTIIVVTIVYFATTFFAYNSNFKLASLQNSFQTNIITSPQISEKQIVLNKYPQIDMQFKAYENNLAVIEMDLTGTNLPNQEFTKQELIMKLKETNTESWQETKIIINSRDHDFKNLFGFSPIPDSKNKTYDLQLLLDQPNSSHQITINANNHLLIAHSSITKSEILNPSVVLNLGINKLIAFVQNPIAQLILILYLPILFICIYLQKKYKL